MGLSQTPPDDLDPLEATLALCCGHQHHPHAANTPVSVEGSLEQHLAGAVGVMSPVALQQWLQAASNGIINRYVYIAE